MVKRMKMMEETLINCVQSQLGDLSSVDAKELGEAIDMIKDFSEAIYYQTITESMEKDKYHKERDNGVMYYDEYPYPRRERKDTERYPMGGYPLEIRDNKEGRSPMVRKTYMEKKIHGEPKETQMYELEKYMQELSSDITEMIEGASHEEKQMLRNKISALAAKIV